MYLRALPLRLARAQQLLSARYAAPRSVRWSSISALSQSQPLQSPQSATATAAALEAEALTAEMPAVPKKRGRPKKVIEEDAEDKPKARGRRKKEVTDENTEEKPKRRARSRKEEVPATETVETEKKPTRRSRVKKEVAETEPGSGSAQMALDLEASLAAHEESKPKRKPRAKKLDAEGEPVKRGRKPGPKPGAGPKREKDAQTRLLDSMGVKTIGKRGATSSYLRAYDPVAEKLAESGIFTGVARKKRGVTVDNTRINITSEALCDDVLTYIKSTLSPRHDGCDIVDLFPGVGVFSRKLNDLLKPRSHLLLEPDEDFYTPFLQPLLDRPGTKLLQKSGIIWEDLEEVLSPEHLPHQVKRKYRLDETPERNDTLLVVVNLSMWPKRRFRTFHNVAALVLYQFMTSMRTAALFQQYGRVRMLIWVEESDKLPLLPRTLQRRRRLSVDVDLNTEWICEVAGPDKADAALTSSSEGWFRRDHNIDLKSMELALARMKEAGITTIPGRETADLKEYLEKVANGEYDPKGSMMGMTKRASKTAVWAEKIYEAWDRGEIEKGTALHKTLKTMRHLDSSNTKNLIKCMDQIDMRLQIEQKLIEAEAKNDALALEVARELEAEWEAYMKEHFAKEKLRADFLLHRDNLIAIQSDPPLLAWDRRYAEPLRVKPEEFFPNVPCSLIDIQPAALDSILREKGPDTNRGGDMFELIAPSLIQAPTSPIEKVLEAAYVGAGTGVIPYCKSLTDPKQGGTPLKGPFGKLTPRLLNAAQLVDIAKAWSNWPFKPTWEDLVVRHTESDVEVRESDILRGNSGGSADDDL